MEKWKKQWEDMMEEYKALQEYISIRVIRFYFTALALIKSCN